MILKKITGNIKLSVAMSLILTVGVAESVKAVNLSPDGLGDALIFPYFSAVNTWQTFFRLVNTSENAIAVKIRFREAANSRDILDFIVLMSPKDIWLGWTDAKALGGKPGIKSSDRSCILPLVGATSNLGEGFHQTATGVIAAQFKDRGFTDANIDNAGKSSIERLKEGHIEVIGIAEYQPGSNLYNSVFHENGVPASCASAKKAFLNGEPNLTTEMGNVIAGNAYMINITMGQGGGYEPTVLANFSSNILGGSFDAKPDLDSADPVSLLLDADSLTIANWDIANPASRYGNNNPDLFRKTHMPSGNTASLTGGVDAVSSILMRTNIINEWAAKDSSGIFNDYFTQWVVTFPTKHHYVDIDANKNKGVIYPTLACSAGDVCAFDKYAYAPFSNRFQAEGKSCEPYQMKLWSREERGTVFTSPRPTANPELCYETNVISFSDKFKGMGLSSSFSNVVPEIFLPTDKENGIKSMFGWANLNFTGKNATKTGLISANGLTLNQASLSNVAGYLKIISSLANITDGQNLAGGVALKGLPVNGFMFSVYKTNKVKNNHLAINKHKYKRDIYNILLEDEMINNVNIGKPRLNDGEPLPSKLN